MYNSFAHHYRSKIQGAYKDHKDSDSTAPSQEVKPEDSSILSAPAKPDLTAALAAMRQGIAVLELQGFTHLADKFKLPVEILELMLLQQ